MLKNNLLSLNLKSHSPALLQSKRAAGDAISALIMFIAVVGISVALVVGIQNFAIDSQTSMNVQNDVVNNQLRTAIEITNMKYNSTEQKVYVYVKNIGETRLLTGDFDLYIDDDYVYNYSVFYANDTSTQLNVLNIQQTSVFVKDKPLSSGSHKVKIVSGYGGRGDTDYFNT